MSLIVFGIGIYLLMPSGFSWLKLLFVLWMTFSSGISSGYVSVGVLTANLIWMIQQVSGIEWWSYEKYSWVALTTISFSMVLFFQYKLLAQEDRKVVETYYTKGLFWMLVCLEYGGLMLPGSAIIERMCKGIFGDVMNLVDLKLVGFFGLGLSLLWIIRERILIWRQK